MPPPVSYIDIDTIPFSRTVTQAEFNVADEIWFRFITAVDVALGGHTTKPSGVGLRCFFYESDGTTLIEQWASSTGFWQALPAGTYYIKFDKFPVGPISADFDYTADTRPLDDITFEPETVIISDDSSSQIPAILLETDGNIPTFVSDIPTGEIGDALPNGYVLVHDRFGKYTLRALILFDPTLLTHITIVPPLGTQFPRIAHSTTDFYVVDAQSGDIWKITDTAVITLVGNVPEILADGVGPWGISPDGTIAYFNIPGTGDISKHIIATGVTTVLYSIPGFDTLADSVAETFNGNPGDLIVLPDGSMVTWWYDDSLHTTKLIHVSSSGILLNTIDFVDPNSVNHLAYASISLSTHIKVWEFVNLGLQSKIGNVNLTTGLYDSSFTIDTFLSGQNSNSNDTDKFGPSSSCPFYTLFEGDVPPPSTFAGVVIIDVNRTTDNFGGNTPEDEIPVVAFFRTALIGD